MTHLEMLIPYRIHFFSSEAYAAEEPPEKAPAEPPSEVPAEMELIRIRIGMSWIYPKMEGFFYPPADKPTPYPLKIR